MTLQSPRTRPRKSTCGNLFAVGGVDSAKSKLLNLGVVDSLLSLFCIIIPTFSSCRSMDLRFIEIVHLFLRLNQKVQHPSNDTIFARTNGLKWRRCPDDDFNSASRFSTTNCTWSVAETDSRRSTRSSVIVREAKDGPASRL